MEYDVGVGAKRNVDGSVENRVVHKERHSSSSTTTSPILVDEFVAWDGRKARRVVELGFLNCGYADAVGV